MVKVEAVVIRERVETVIDAVEEATRHVGVTVVEAGRRGRRRRRRHEDRGRIRSVLDLGTAVDILDDHVNGDLEWG